MGFAPTSKDRAGHVTKRVQMAPACSALSAPGDNTREQGSLGEGCEQHCIPWCLGMLEAEAAPSSSRRDGKTKKIQPGLQRLQ